jgi:hypothetical protein
MKTFIIAALLTIASVATLGAPAQADTFSVHGILGGNSYGR